MKKIFTLLSILISILLLTSCSSTNEVANSSTNMEIEKIGVASSENLSAKKDYIYKVDGNVSIIPKNIAAWNFGKINKYFADSVYSSVVKVTSGIENNENAAKMVFLMNKGYLKGYSSIKFKVKTENYQAVNIFIEGEKGPYLSKLQPVKKGNWNEITISLKKFGREKQLEKCDKILFVGDGPGVIYLTDFALIK